jgi:TRAP-type C4-dicarboxylate transport system substrate-binding protein
LPFLITNDKELAKAMDILKPYLDEELNKYGAQLLYYYPWPPQNLWGKGEPVTEIKNIEGLKFRSQGPETAYFLESQKAFPVSLTTPEVPSAVQRGVADGVITAALNALGSKWYDFLNWGYIINLQTTPSYIVINKSALEQLPEDLKNVLLEVAAEHEKNRAGEISQIEKESMDTLQKQYNIEIHEASVQERDQLTKASVDYWNQWVKEKGGKSAEALEKIRAALNK